MIKVFGVQTLTRQVVIATLLLCSACGFAVPITEQAIAYNDTAERSENDMLLKNVVRASRKGPLYFTRIVEIENQLKGSAGVNVDTQLGAASELLSTQTFTLSASSSPNFVLQIFNTKEFFNGFNRPLDPADVQLFLNDGWPLRSLIFAIVEEAVIFAEFEAGPPRACKIIGDLDGPTGDRPYSERQKLDLLFRLLDSRNIRRIARHYEDVFQPLAVGDVKTVEQIENLLDEGYRIDRATQAEAKLQLQRVLNPNFTIFSAPGNDASFRQLAVEELAKGGFPFCNDRAPHDDPALADFISNIERLASAEVPGRRQFSVRLTLRSARGLFYALGEMMNFSLRDPDRAAQFGFFSVERGLVAPPEVISTRVGATAYWIPADETGDQSRRLLSLAQQVFSINASAEDAPSSNILRVDTIN